MIYVNTQIKNTENHIDVNPDNFPELYNYGDNGLIEFARNTSIKLNECGDLVIQSIDTPEVLTEKVNEFIETRKADIVNNIKKQLQVLYRLNTYNAEADKLSDVSKLIRVYTNLI